MHEGIISRDIISLYISLYIEYKQNDTLRDVSQDKKILCLLLEENYILRTLF